MLFSIVNNPVISANELYHDLLYHWDHQWKREFNPNPPKQANVLFSCKKVSPAHPHLIFIRTVLSKMSELKYLSLILELDLFIDKDLNIKMIMARKNSNICQNCLKTLDEMYKAIVRAHLDYSDIIFPAPPILNQPTLGLPFNILPFSKNVGHPKITFFFARMYYKSLIGFNISGNY